MSNDNLIPQHGGFRKLRSFQCAQIVYDGTVIFCDRFIDKRSRTHDQMVQAARSGVQNIAEGSLASATSKKTELKLTSVARASLLLDYEDFLRQRKLRWLYRKNVQCSQISKAKNMNCPRLCRIVLVILKTKKAALLGRDLDARGFRVGIIPQPDPEHKCETSPVQQALGGSNFFPEGGSPRRRR